MKLLLALFVAAVIAGTCYTLQSNSTPVVRHTPVNHVPQHIFAAGRVEGASLQRDLRPRAPGRITELLVQEGEQVEAGQVLLRVDDSQHRHEVALAAAELKLAEGELHRLINGARDHEREEAKALHRAKVAELQQARLRWQRLEQLRQRDAVNQQELDDQRSLVSSLQAQAEAAKARAQLIDAPAREDEVGIARSRVEAAQARVELARVQLDRTQLRAPADGQVLKINAEVGEFAGETTPEPALVWADTSRYRVRAFVEELDAPRVRVGMQANVVADGLPEGFTGRISRLSPQMTSKQVWTDAANERLDTKTREVWIEFDGAPQLVIGLRVDVFINAGTHSVQSATPSKQPRLSLDSPLAAN